jgi:DNA-binding NarL/FixJ family response regulator
MITDDQQLIRDSLKFLLERIPDVKEVLTAENGQVAIEILKENELDVIVMDLNMPIVNGIDAITEIRKFNQKVKILVLTSLLDDTLIQKALDQGANAYLLKNTSPENLITVIKKILTGEKVLDQTIAQNEEIHDIPSPSHSVAYI